MEILGLILGLFFGLIIGASLVNLKVKQTKSMNEILKATINELEKELDRANFKIERRNNFVKDYQEEHEVLLNDISKLKTKITDLENNIELLTNNLSDENKELVQKLQAQN